MAKKKNTKTLVSEKIENAKPKVENSEIMASTENIIIAEKEEAGTEKTVACRNLLNVRKFPSLNAQIVRTICNGDKVKVYEEVEDWSRISEEQSEYVMTQYLK